MSSDANPGIILGKDLSSAVVLFHQAVAAKVGMTAGDLKTLELIEREGPFNATELARRTGLTGAAITSLVGRLAAKGHVVREVDPVDRRRAVIRAIPSANSALEAAFTHLGIAMGGIVGGYGADEQLAIVDFLTKTIAVMREETSRLAAPSRETVRPARARRGAARDS